MNCYCDYEPIYSPTSRLDKQEYTDMYKDIVLILSITNILFRSANIRISADRSPSSGSVCILVARYTLLSVGEDRCLIGQEPSC